VTAVDPKVTLAQLICAFVAIRFLPFRQKTKDEG
jgi:hypothetical protein